MAGSIPQARCGRLSYRSRGSCLDTLTAAFGAEASAFARIALTLATDGGCRTRPCTKTWAALAVMAVEGPGSAEAEQSVPRPSDDLRGFRPHPQNDSSEGFRGLCDTLDEKQASERIITKATNGQATSGTLH
jgi:hypothetical protein